MSYILALGRPFLQSAPEQTPTYSDYTRMPHFHSRSSDPIPPKFKSHPIWPIRLGTLITSAIGVILCLICLPATREYNLGPFIWSVILFLASIFYCLYDLITWSLSSSSIQTPLSASNTRQSQTLPRPTQSPRSGEQCRDTKQWPRLALLIWDAVFALLFQWTFWLDLAATGSGYSYYSPVPVIFQAWGALAVFVCSVLHAIAFWKELMARQKQRWEKRRVGAPCQRCGFVNGEEVEDGGERDEAGGGEAVGGSESPAAVVDALNRSIKDRLPRWMKGANVKPGGGEADVEAGEGTGESEEDLLITPQETGESAQKSYGGLENEGEASLPAPEECVVKKKGKSRIVGTGDDVLPTGRLAGELEGNRRRVGLREVLNAM